MPRLGARRGSPPRECRARWRPARAGCRSSTGTTSRWGRQPACRTRQLSSCSLLPPRPRRPAARSQLWSAQARGGRGGGAARAAAVPPALPSPAAHAPQATPAPVAAALGTPGPPDERAGLVDSLLQYFEERDREEGEDRVKLRVKLREAVLKSVPPGDRARARGDPRMVAPARGRLPRARQEAPGHPRAPTSKCARVALTAGGTLVGLLQPSHTLPMTQPESAGDLPGAHTAAPRPARQAVRAPACARGLAAR